MKDLDTLRKQLRRFKPDAVARLSGRSAKTVQRIRDGINSPSLRTFLALEAALKALQPVVKGR